MTAAIAPGAIYAIWAREIKRSLRDPGQLVGAFTRPVLWVLVFGAGLNPYFRGGFGEVTFVVPFTYVQFVFPAVAALNVMYASIQSAVSLIWDREFGFFKEVFASPTPRLSIFLGKLLGGATMATAQGALVFLLAPAADVPLSWGQIVRMVGLAFALAAALTALGIIIAVHSESFQGFGVFANALILPLYFLASSVFPLDPSLSVEQQLEVFPAWLVFVVRVNPVSYALDALRHVALGYTQFDPRMDYGVLAGTTLAATALAYREFRRS